MDSDTSSPSRNASPVSPSNPVTPSASAAVPTISSDRHRKNRLDPGSPCRPARARSWSSRRRFWRPTPTTCSPQGTCSRQRTRPRAGKPDSTRVLKQWAHSLSASYSGQHRQHLTEPVESKGSASTPNRQSTSSDGTRHAESMQPSARRMSVPRPAMFVAIVTAPTGLPPLSSAGCC